MRGFSSYLLIVALIGSPFAARASDPVFLQSSLWNFEPTPIKVTYLLADKGASISQTVMPGEFLILGKTGNLRTLTIERFDKEGAEIVEKLEISADTLIDKWDALGAKMKGERFVTICWKDARTTDEIEYYCRIRNSYTFKEKKESWSREYSKR